MNTFDRIDKLLKEKEKKQIELTNFLGIPKSKYTDWKKGRTNSYEKYLKEIAIFFNVSVDYIVGNTENKNFIQNDKLTEQEQILINTFRASPEEAKQRIIQSVLNIHDEYEKKNQAADSANAG